MVSNNMTFTTRLKEEISKIPTTSCENKYIISAFLRYNATFSNDNIIICLENASVTRFIYKIIKEYFEVYPKIRVRVQKRFRIKQIYILEITEKINEIKSIIDYDNEVVLNKDEDKIAFIKGAFLGIGNVSNPKTSGYHLEFILNDNKQANYINKLLNYFKLKAKVIKRGNKYITYIKMSENISDLIKMFKAINSLFEFEDTRIYRDHKNMVNRLNNCELANQEKTIKTGIDQLEIINYIEKHNLVHLLDEKCQLIMEYRKKYPESSFQELSEIISLETDYKIGKSGINHQFIKLRKLKENHLGK